ncbi:MAG: hypothetical protein OXT67_12780 [Zetaproteobacteria bacterium]|nr:hypothetical protein [Zetaproteobacteria bacterium]MDD9952428.1 hypothetical protein [Zetaproteobacteria bacterium]
MHRFVPVVVLILSSLWVSVAFATDKADELHVKYGQNIKYHVVNIPWLLPHQVREHYKEVGANELPSRVPMLVAAYMNGKALVVGTFVSGPESTMNFVVEGKTIPVMRDVDAEELIQAMYLIAAQKGSLAAEQVFFDLHVYKDRSYDLSGFPMDANLPSLVQGVQKAFYISEPELKRYLTAPATAKSGQVDCNCCQHVFCAKDSGKCWSRACSTFRSECHDGYDGKGCNVKCQSSECEGN